LSNRLRVLKDKDQDNTIYYYTLKIKITLVYNTKIERGGMDNR